jgi:hypothetical protein
MRDQEDPSSRPEDTVKHSDPKIRMTMFQALGDKAAIEGELNQLDASHEGNLVLENLVG